MIAKIVLAGLLAVVSVSVKSQVKYGDWEVELADDKEDIYLSANNQEGHLLMRTCNISSNTCTWAFTVDSACGKMGNYGALGNSAAGSYFVD